MVPLLQVAHRQTRPYEPGTGIFSQAGAENVQKVPNLAAETVELLSLAQRRHPFRMSLS